LLIARFGIWLHEADQHPTVTHQQSFEVDQRARVADRFLTGFDRRATALDQQSIVGCVVIPVQDKSCPYSDPADARSLHGNILVRLRPTPDTITR
jgi:hypothetical protein